MNDTSMFTSDGQFSCMIHDIKCTGRVDKNGWLVFGKMVTPGGYDLQGALSTESFVADFYRPVETLFRKEIDNFMEGKG